VIEAYAGSEITTALLGIDPRRRAERAVLRGKDAVAGPASGGQTTLVGAGSEIAPCDRGADERALRRSHASRWRSQGDDHGREDFGRFTITQQVSLPVRDAGAGAVWLHLDELATGAWRVVLGRHPQARRCFSSIDSSSARHTVRRRVNCFDGVQNYDGPTWRALHVHRRHTCCSATSGAGSPARRCVLVLLEHVLARWASPSVTVTAVEVGPRRLRGRRGASTDGHRPGPETGSRPGCRETRRCAPARDPSALCIEDMIMPNAAAKRGSGKTVRPTPGAPEDDAPCSRGRKRKSTSGPRWRRRYSKKSQRGHTGREATARHRDISRRTGSSLHSGQPLRSVTPHPSKWARLRLIRRGGRDRPFGDTRANRRESRPQRNYRGDRPLQPCEHREPDLQAAAHGRFQGGRRRGRLLRSRATRADGGRPASPRVRANGGLRCSWRGHQLA